MLVLNSVQYKKRKRKEKVMVVNMLSNTQGNDFSVFVFKGQ